MHRSASPGILAQVIQLPLFLQAAGIAALSMLVPAAHALAVEAFSEARAFLYSGLLGFMTVALVGIAMAGRRPRHGPLGPLLSLFAVMLLLPIALAVPLYEGLRTTTFLNAYLEMVSAVTTTGASVFDDPARLSSPLHLWRAQVAWLGGLVMWVAAVAVMAPLNLGGFEVTARAEPGREDMAINQMQNASTHIRVLRAGAALVPIYLGLTMLLWVLLIVMGEGPLVALCHAMSILSTSGISPVGGLEAAGSGITGELVMCLFMIFALSRLTFSSDTVTSPGPGLLSDPELRLALVIIIGAPLILFARHWLGAFDVDQEANPAEALRALWGLVFTTVSFLTTTGFASQEWDTAQAWSGLTTPGLVLMGLALIGGGVATTAGGVKLLRVFALYRQGLREMEKLVHPSSVSGARGMGRRLQRQGAFIAWIFFMLYALSLAALSLAFTATGVGFEQAMILAVGGLSNTGPLIVHAGEAPISLNSLSVSAKAVLVAAMVVGRLETLAIIALVTPDLWRG